MADRMQSIIDEQTAVRERAKTAEKELKEQKKALKEAKQQAKLLKAELDRHTQLFQEVGELFKNFSSKKV